jgi:4-hydroxybenzoate polyprenyltransferase
MNENKKNSSPAAAFFRLLRFERTLMAAVITGSAAFAAGVGILLSLWMALSGWCVAAGGFSLDSFIQRKAGQKSRESLSPVIALASSLFFIALSIAVTFQVNPLALVPLILILFLVIIMDLPFFKKPLVYTLTVGLLHALHLLMGGAAGVLRLPLILPAVVLFFAIAGARGIIDIRNFPKDLMTRKQTMPKRFGLTGTVKISLLCFIIAYGLAIGTYFTAAISLLYLYPVVILVIAGTICIFLFVKNAGPEMARKLTPFFTLITILLICLALILGSL